MKDLLTAKYLHLQEPFENQYLNSVKLCYGFFFFQSEALICWHFWGSYNILTTLIAAVHLSFNLYAKRQYLELSWSQWSSPTCIFSFPPQMSLADACVFLSPQHFSSLDWNKSSTSFQESCAWIQDLSLGDWLIPLNKSKSYLVYSCAALGIAVPGGKKSIGPVWLFKSSKIANSHFVSFLSAEICGVFCLTKQCRLLCAFVVDLIPLCQQLVLVTLETALNPTEDFDRHILTEIALFSQFCKYTCS